MVDEKKLEKIYNTCVNGIKNYAKKNNFKTAVLGLSGGIDSALTLTLAVDALSNKNVTALLMPSQYSSAGSIDDSLELCKNLVIKYEIINIEKIYEAFSSAIELGELAAQNIQARIRGVILMSFSNNTNSLVLATGNKSEALAGYATMYGDTVGGYAPIINLYKTVVYQVANFRNKNGHPIHPIPNEILEKEPSAELKHNQKDSDSLPEYDTLDEILRLYYDNKKDIVEIVEQGFDEQVVLEVKNMISASEWKRKQAAEGPKIDNL